MTFPLSFEVQSNSLEFHLRESYLLGCTDTANGRHTRVWYGLTRRRRCLRVGVTSKIFFFGLTLTRLRLGPNRADSHRLGPYRAKLLKHTDIGVELADSSRNSKKKKKVDILRYGGDVRECLCVRQRENERENKLNTYLFAFRIKNEATSKRNYSSSSRGFWTWKS